MRECDFILVMCRLVARVIDLGGDGGGISMQEDRHAGQRSKDRGAPSPLSN